MVHDCLVAKLNSSVPPMNRFSRNAPVRGSDTITLKRGLSIGPKVATVFGKADADLIDRDRSEYDGSVVCSSGARRRTMTSRR